MSCPTATTSWGMRPTPSAICCSHRTLEKVWIPDSFNFHLSQLRMKVEQAFGILVQRRGILWKPLRISFDRRPKLVRALFHLHNFCIDGGSKLIRREHEQKNVQRFRPTFTSESSLPAEYQTPQLRRLRRIGEVETRISTMLSLQRLGQGQLSVTSVQTCRGRRGAVLFFTCTRHTSGADCSVFFCSSLGICIFRSWWAW